ncbi:cyclase family protein [Methylobacterium sp. NMS14P]|uniref:cyclase family protein n=1 Tax=Methylobacterium sp. NMS14P TaxID=2894310 RepID=UPI002359791C|nr:cyclase family protein [Methylobacterium sp. NMS14P]WCS25657.1 cyclase family protein [Methylobacterium sp. NMS14P]
MQRIVDISMAIENGVPSDPPGYEFEVSYIGHGDTVPMLQKRYDGLRGEDLIGGEAFALESVRLSTHNGTHVDAPWHYASTMADGTPSRTIDQMPLDWFFQPGVKLDFRAFDDGYIVQPNDIDRELERIGHTLRPLDIVVVNTSAGARFGTAAYPQSGCGMGRAATLHLASKGVRVVGTDAWSWDAPFKYVAERYHRDRDPSIIWEGHKAGRDVEYCQIEKLRHLDQLPPSGFRIACFPVKIHAASAGWTRAVAIFDEPANQKGQS